MCKYKENSRHNAIIMFESSIDIGDWSYLIIFGKHINGYFCAIPNHNISCEMTEPERVIDNFHYLLKAGVDEHIAKSIATAICDIAYEMKPDFEIEIVENRKKGIVYSLEEALAKRKKVVDKDL